MKQALCLVAAMLLSACSVGMPKSGPANSYIGIVNVDEGQAFNNQVADTKRGEACVLNILGLVATGDASVEKAKRNGNIKDVYTINREVFGLTLYFPIYGKSCTVVRGS